MNFEFSIIKTEPLHWWDLWTKMGGEYYRTVVWVDQLGSFKVTHARPIMRDITEKLSLQLRKYANAQALEELRNTKDKILIEVNPRKQ